MIKRSEREDLNLFVPKEIYLLEPSWDEMLRAAIDKGAAFTLWWEGKPVAFVGGTRLWKGVYEVWAVTSDELSKCGVAATLALSKLLRRGMVITETHRVQMTVRSKYREGIKWACALGFKPECQLDKYGQDKSDYIMMVRF